MDSIFCFKFNDITGELIRIEVPEYRISENYNTGKKKYSFANTITKDGSNYVVTEDKFDRFVNNKVFLYEDNVVKAYDIMEESLKTDIDRLEREKKRKKALLNLYLREKIMETR